MDKRNREKLFASITATSFVRWLKALLDTHPNDQKALDCWKKYNKIRKKQLKSIQGVMDQ